MLKVGITGQAGFIGTHLFNTVGLYSDRMTRIPFEDTYFDSDELLFDFVRKCDAIFHLAAQNRNENPDELYEVNIDLTKKLIRACELTNSRPHILFSSSIQENYDNPYGKSKKECRRLLELWARNNGAVFTGLIFPNVFGPFGRPFHNSVVATFCHQLTNNQMPEIRNDNEIKLVYVSEVVNSLIDILLKQRKKNISSVSVVSLNHSNTIRVSDLLVKLSGYKEKYLKHGVIPDLSTSFDRDLFNTFCCYINHEKFFPFFLTKNTDERGEFVETIKTESGGQFSYSVTKPGITRGNHYHTRKDERFAVVSGNGIIKLRRIGTDRIYTFHLKGSTPSFVDIPIWFTHNITNTGRSNLYTIFWISEHYDPDNSDTYFEQV